MAEVVKKLGVGPVRARCAATDCAVEFDRVAPDKHKAVAEAIANLGYEITGGTLATSKKQIKFGADVRFRAKKRLPPPGG